MMRRLGQSAYRSESPHIRDQDTISLDSTCTLPSIDYSRDEDAISLMTLTMEEASDETAATPVPDGKEFSQSRHAEKDEITTISANVCRKLDTIVALVADFTSDVMSLRERAPDLLKELRGKVLPYLINLDMDMTLAENLVRYNIDHSNINEDRIDWLLQYNKYHMEMRRVFRELSGTVYEDLEDALELRCRGVIARRAKTETVENLTEMRRGMQRAVSLLCC